MDERRSDTGSGGTAAPFGTMYMVSPTKDATSSNNRYSSQQEQQYWNIPDPSCMDSSNRSNGVADWGSSGVITAGGSLFTPGGNGSNHRKPGFLQSALQKLNPNATDWNSVANKSVNSGNNSTDRESISLQSHGIWTDDSYNSNSQGQNGSSYHSLHNSLSMVDYGGNSGGTAGGSIPAYNRQNSAPSDYTRHSHQQYRNTSSHNDRVNHHQQQRQSHYSSDFFGHRSESALMQPSSSNSFYDHDAFASLSGSPTNSIVPGLVPAKSSGSVSVSTAGSRSPSYGGNNKTSSLAAAISHSTTYLQRSSSAIDDSSSIGAQDGSSELQLPSQPMYHRQNSSGSNRSRGERKPRKGGRGGKNNRNNGANGGRGQSRNNEEGNDSFHQDNHNNSLSSFLQYPRGTGGSIDEEHQTGASSASSAALRQLQRGTSISTSSVTSNRGGVTDDHSSHSFCVPGVNDGMVHHQSILPVQQDQSAASFHTARDISKRDSSYGGFERSYSYYGGATSRHGDSGGAKQHDEFQDDVDYIFGRHGPVLRNPGLDELDPADNDDASSDDNSWEAVAGRNPYEDASLSMNGSGEVSPRAKKRDWLQRMNRKLNEVVEGELDPNVVPISAVMNAWAKTKSAQGASMVEIWLKRAEKEFNLGNKAVVPTTKMYTMAGMIGLFACPR